MMHSHNHCVPALTIFLCAWPASTFADENVHKAPTEAEQRNAYLAEICRTAPDQAETNFRGIRYLNVSGVDLENEKGEVNAFETVNNCVLDGWRIARVCNPKSEWKSMSRIEAVKLMADPNTRLFTCYGEKLSAVIGPYRSEFLRIYPGGAKCNNLLTQSRCTEGTTASLSNVPKLRGTESVSNAQN